VATDYDAEDRPTRVRRWDAANGAGVGEIVDSMAYDLLGRLVRRKVPGYGPLYDSTLYDAASNVIATRSRRGLWVFMQYDALNRLTQRTLPAVTYQPLTLGLAGIPWQSQGVPVAPYPDPAAGWGLSPSDPNRLAGEVETFTYDPGTGQLATAHNAAARVARTYYANGWVRTDSTRIATLDGVNFDAHRFGLTILYDRDGRRTTLTSPIGPYQYSYAPGLGELTRLVNPLADTVKLAYDTLGRVNRVQTGNNRMTQLLAYDLDGALTWDYVMSAGGMVPWPAQNGAIRSASLFYTPDGRLSRMTSSGRFGLALDNVYNTLGQLERVASLATSLPSSGSSPFVDQAVSTYTHDPLGNLRASGRQVVQSFFNGGGMLGVPRQMASSGDVLTMAFASDGTGRLTSSSSQSSAGATTAYTYDEAGNTRTSSLPWGVGRGGQDRVSYYDALDRLRVVESRTSAPPANSALPILLTLRDESRYDALGRRVLFTSRRKCMANTPAERDCRRGYVQRTVWDGAREVLEIRAPSADVYVAQWPDLMERDSTLPALPVHPEGNFVLDPNPYFGTVGYGYVGGIDRPATVERLAYRDKWRANWGSGWHPSWAPAASQPLFETSFTVFPQWNAQGTADLGAVRDGGQQHCVLVLQPVRCTAALQWEATYWPLDPGLGFKWSWVGSLLENKRDPSGLLYRRHRYLDTQAGRFTQEDPIGLAGGLNAYNYADGDPVNFEDPLGLCPMCIAYAIFEVGSTAYDVYDLAKTTASFIGGRASRTELAITAAGVGAGIVGFGGGYGKAGREAASRLIRDVLDNPNNWKAVGSFTEAAINKKAKGGVSIQTIMENAEGDRVVRHTVRDKAGDVIEDHYRPMYKARDVDRPKTP
jgi:RHS repeat-associated protein